MILNKEPATLIHTSDMGCLLNLTHVPRKK